MRAWWCLGLFGFAACSMSTPLGSYRLPVQTSDTTVELRTILATVEGSDLILFDASQRQEFARGHGDLYSAQGTSPYVFKAPSGFPLNLTVNAAVIQDDSTRPYTTLPIAPLQQGGSSVTRVTLSSGSEQLTVVTVNGAYFTESAENQPAATDLPGPLFALSSVAGTGLWIPVDAASMSTWHDSMTTFAPPVTPQQTFCGAPLVASIRSTPGVSVKVPAGSYQATQVTEMIDACQQAHPADVLVYEIDRWYVPGVGPVKMSYKGSDSKTREYNLVSSQVTGDAQALWPLEQNNRWTYQIVGPDGMPAGAPVDVTVSAVNVVSAPQN